jgi:hypothetical protein
MPEEHSGQLTDQQIALAIRGLGLACLAAVEGEIQKLTPMLALMEDVFTYRAIDNWMSVWSVTNTLTSGDEVEKLVSGVPPQSLFHKKPGKAQDLVTWLGYWRAQGFFSNQDSLVTAYNILNQRMTDDVQFVKDFQ